jgi:hypothetical protein
LKPESECHCEGHNGQRNNGTDSSKTAPAPARLLEEDLRLMAFSQGFVKYEHQARVLSRKSRTSRKSIDDLDHFIGSVALRSTKLDKLTHVLDHRTFLSRTGHCDAATSLEVEKALVAEYVERTKDRVLVDAEHCGNVGGQRKSFSGPGFTVGKRPADFGCYLVVQRYRFFPVDMQGDHGPINSSSIFSFRIRGI